MFYQKTTLYLFLDWR